MFDAHTGGHLARKLHQREDFANTHISSLQYTLDTRYYKPHTHSRICVSEDGVYTILKSGVLPSGLTCVRVVSVCVCL